MLMTNLLYYIVNECFQLSVITKQITPADIYIYIYICSIGLFLILIIY